MSSLNRSIRLAIVFAVILSIGLQPGCKQGFEARYGPFFVESDTTVFMDGDMGSRIDIQFEKLIEDYPDLQLMTFAICPGSKDDDALVIAGTALRNHGIDTHLTPTSVIESGAVDLFLAGNVRTREEGSLIGVHAWSEGSKSATDYPMGHPVHDLYIDYYEFCGYTSEDAEELYYFIINAASPNDIHYMTDEEIEQYNIVTH